SAVCGSSASAGACPRSKRGPWRKRSPSAARTWPRPNRTPEGGRPPSECDRFRPRAVTAFTSGAAGAGRTVGRARARIRGEAPAWRRPDDRRGGGGNGRKDQTGGDKEALE